MISVLLKRRAMDREFADAVLLLAANGIIVAVNDVGGSVRPGERESALRLLRSRPDLMPIVDEEGRSIVASGQGGRGAEVVEVLEAAGSQPRVLWEHGAFVVDVADGEYRRAVSVLSSSQDLGEFIQPPESRKDRGHVNVRGGSVPAWHTLEGRIELLGAPVRGTLNPPPTEYAGLPEVLDRVWEGRRDLLRAEERLKWADYFEREVIPRVTGPDAKSIELRTRYVLARIAYLRGDTTAAPGRFADWVRRHGQSDPK